MPDAFLGGQLYGRYLLRLLERPEEMPAVEELQGLIWPGDEREIVPAHMLLAVAHNGGLIIGAYDIGEPVPDEAGRGLIPGDEHPLVGFVFGFPGLVSTGQGPRIKHSSHMMGVHPDYRNQGIGFTLKRAQWQMVRRQGLECITWTYDPLLSRNAYLNIARLGAVCETYIQEAYGRLRDGLNVGLPSDRFQVDWWVNSQRVRQRLSKRPRRRLDLAHYLAAETPILNPSQMGEDNLVRPAPPEAFDASLDQDALGDKHPLVLVEIPADLTALKAASPALALEWRLHTRALFTTLFDRGYLVTDFIHLPGTHPRSFYILSFGESTL